MRRLASIATAIVAASVTGCGASAGGDAASRPIAPITAPGAPAAPSVVASGCSTWMSAPESVAGLVHIRTTLQVRHAHAPQAGVRGLVTVSSIDVAFISGGAQVGWATQATPQGHAPLLISNGNTVICWGTTHPNITEVTASGQKVMEVSLPSNQYTYRAYRQAWLARSRRVNTGPLTLLSLAAAKPNPFRDVTEMVATLSRSGSVTAIVFDASGREIHNVVQTLRDSPRVYRVQVNLAGRPSGVYFCRVLTPAGGQSQRIVH